ncbi:MAG: DUF433 domain-containing protein, partial [Planktothrix sp.]|uniref:DUF433 domain-containing protein n=1 Tax=Planktothrix sp. TaxID=3088171 RepID=UPI0038D411DA
NFNLILRMDNSTFSYLLISESDRRGIILKSLNINYSESFIIMSKESVITEHIEITPGVLGGKPCISGHRIAVAHIAEMYLKMGISIEEIAGKYDLSLA